jgi:digeranylgeranylglycerophospholipid reductase
MAQDFDVIVVGAGPAGSLAARDLARAGFTVGLFDADQREDLGKTIIIEAEKQSFLDAGVEPPSGDDIPYHAACSRFFSGRGKEAFSIEGELPGVALYLDRLAKRMAKDAEDAGVKFFAGWRALSPVVSGGRVVGAVFQTGDRQEEVRSRITIDASGYSATLVRQLDPGLGIRFSEAPGDLVVAENRFYKIDQARAKEAVWNGLQADEESWCRMGLCGPYSTRLSHLSLKNSRGYILVGLKAQYGTAPSELIGQHRKEQGYFDEQLYAGGGPIRIRHSLDRLVADGFMVVGEAACTVMPVHGSGVSSGLVTGHLAAKAAINALKENKTDTAGLWPYAHQYQSGRGAVLATYAVSRLAVDMLTQDQVGVLIEEGLMSKDDAFSAFVPRFAAITFAPMLKRVAGMARHPDLTKPLLKIARGVPAAKSVYQKYPRSFDADAFAHWQKRADDIFRMF